MEQLLELLAGFGIDKAQLGVIIIAGVILAVKAWLGNKKVEDALETARTVYSSIEKARNLSNVKDIIRKRIEAVAKDRPQVAIIDELLTASVDPKKDLAEVNKKVPAIKRAWRRMLAGKNIGGILLKIAAR